MQPLASIIAARDRAPLHLTLAMDSIALAETRGSGGTYVCRVEGQVLTLHRGSEPQPGARLIVELPCWDAMRPAGDRRGPGRIFYGVNAPLGRVELWGRMVDGEFVVATYSGDDEMRDDEAVALDRIDRVVRALSEAEPRTPRSVSIATGLELRRGENCWRAEASGAVSTILSAVLSDQGRVTLTLRPAPCVRAVTVRQHYGIESHIDPVPRGQPLPACWHVIYERHWGELRFGFLMHEPHQLDGCLVELVLD